MSSVLHLTLHTLVSYLKPRFVPSAGALSSQAIGRQVLIQPGQPYHPAPGYVMLEVVEGHAWVTHSRADQVLVRGQRLELTRHDTDLAIAALGNRPLRLILR
jgi:hypothetical protein